MDNQLQLDLGLRNVLQSNQAVSKDDSHIMTNDFNREFDRKLLAEAIRIRIELALDLAPTYLKEYDDKHAYQCIRNSLLETLLERRPFDNCLQKLAFSQSITRKAVNKVLVSDRTPVEKIGLVGYLVELSARDFIDPNNPEKKEKNLAASKKFGYFFTPISLANEMSKLLLHSGTEIKSILDPACGTGTLLAVSILNNRKLENVVGVEIDSFTSGIATKLLNQISDDLNIRPRIQILNMDFLDFVSRNTNQTLISNGVDGIIMNPPYGRIRFTTSNLLNDETKIRLNDIDTTRLKTILRKEHIESAQEYRKRFRHIGLGRATPEYSTLFVGSSIELLKHGGKMVAITPTSWLSDKNGTGLRKFIFENHGLKEIWNFKETASMFPGVNQPTSVVLISAFELSSCIKIKADIKSIKDLYKDIHDLDVDKVYKFSPNWLRIPKYGNSRGDLLAKIHLNKNLASHYEIQNLRGEFDLTFNKDLIVKDNNGTRLIRGDHIKQYFLKDPEDSEKEGYVDSRAFFQRIGNGMKMQHISNWRVALPQCTYMQKQKRIEACLVPPNSVIANSCNYIALSQNRAPEEIMNTLLIYCVYLNSLVVEWRFRLFNSNNHIANYEIDELPIVNVKEMSAEFKESILSIIKTYLKTRNEIDLFHLEILVAKSYSLNADDFGIILKDLNFGQFESMMKLYDNE